MAASAAVGVGGLALSRRRHPPPPWFWFGVGSATALMISQVALGVYLLAVEGRRSGDQHVFYGMVIAFVFGFAYIYRAQLARRPAYYYGLLFLFVMGLGLRTIATFGLDF